MRSSFPGTVTVIVSPLRSKRQSPSGFTGFSQPTVHTTEGSGKGAGAAGRAPATANAQQARKIAVRCMGTSLSGAVYQPDRGHSRAPDRGTLPLASEAD